MTMGDSDVTVVITLRDIYLTQQEMVKQLAELQPSLKQGADHESRIRLLEQFRYTSLGIIIVLTFIINVIAVIVEAKLFHTH